MNRVQRSPRQPSGDLFPTDEPIPASQMIGRADDVAELAVALASGTSVTLAGPRRTGKTSVCDAALTRVASQGLYVAQVDLFSSPMRPSWLRRSRPLCCATARRCASCWSARGSSAAMR